ncbi:MAG: hypothetical protein JJT78_14665 [Leptospira sp.]|nr:hypothetical protein [Leptospira sp.]
MIFKKEGVSLFLILILFSSFRHHSSLIGEEEKEKPLRAGLQSDQGELEASIPLAPERDNSRLPSRFSLKDKLPVVLSQKGQASSVGFALGYALKSYTENEKKEKPINLSKLSIDNSSDQKLLFSPTYLYNATNQGKDQGGSLLQGLIILRMNGILTWEDLPYREDDYKSRSYLKDRASLAHRIHNFYKIPNSNLNQIKSYISSGSPLPASVLFYKGYAKYKKNEIIQKTDGSFLGAQAVLIAGYDDSKKAFLVMNSWGVDWGDDGYAWVDYKFFQKSVQSIYWVDDPPLLPSPDKLSESYPTDISASKGNYKDKIRLSWNSVRGAIGYEIYRKRTTANKYELVGLSLNPFFDDAGVQSELSYHYTVATVFSSDSSLPYPGNSEGFASTKTRPISGMRITGLVASQGNFKDRIEISWNPIPGNTSYHIYKYNPYSKQFRILSKVSKPEFTDRKALRNGNLEFYRVSVAGSYVESTLSQAALGNTSAITMNLPPPDSVKVSQGDFAEEIRLEWNNVEGAENYKIYRMPTNAKQWEELAETKSNTYIDKNPKDSSNYYSIAALNRIGNPSRGSLPVMGSLSQLRGRSMGLHPPKKLETRMIPHSSKDPYIRITWEPVKDANSYSIYTRDIGGSWKKLSSTKANYFQDKIDSGKIRLFSVTSNNDSEIEGAKSKEIPVAFMEPVVDNVKSRSFGTDSNLEKFKGPWSTMYWDGKGNITQLQLVIQSDDEQNTTCKVLFNNRTIYQGDYIQETKIHDPKGRFQIAMGDTEQALKMDIKDKTIFPETTTLSFLRD